MGKLSEKMQALLGKASMYSNLYTNPDFIVWKEEVVDRRLDSLAKHILKTDPDSLEHKKFTLQYQELKYICEDIFRVWQSTEDKLRKKEKKEESS